VGHTHKFTFSSLSNHTLHRLQQLLCPSRVKGSGQADSGQARTFLSPRTGSNWLFHTGSFFKFKGATTQQHSSLAFPFTASLGYTATRMHACTNPPPNPAHFNRFR
jgi:hypothetical protein